MRILIALLLLTSVALADQVLVQVKFTKWYNGIPFDDALWFTEEEYAEKTEQQIEDMKDERFENWKYAMENPAVVNEEVINEEISVE